MARVRKFTVVGSVLTFAALAVSAASSTIVAPRPDGRIVFASERAVPGQPGADSRNGEIYSLDLASGRRRDLSRNLDYERSPALSPDGRWIAFARASSSGDGALWLMRRDGRAQRRLANLQVLFGDNPIAWSPDGSKLVFSAGGPSIGLWVVSVDGRGLNRLTDFDADTPVWSPDGTRIAFAGSADAPSTHVGVVAADGTGLRWLTRTRNFDRQPAWSPDGRRIVFVGKDSYAENLFVIGADGAGERRLTRYDPTNSTGLDSPSWSPNGRQIVFLRADDVDLVRPDGGGLRRIARRGLAPAVWSLDGKRLAFAQHVDRVGEPSRVALTVKPLAGPARHFGLESASSEMVGGPSWAPNARGLIYASVSDENDLELFSITPHGRGLRQLTRNRVDDFDPAWSPEGRRIAFARGAIDRNENRVRRSSLYLMDSSGGHPRRLTRGGPDTAPSWAPGGKRIVFARSGIVYILDLPTSRARSLQAGVDPAWSPDGRLIAFADDTRLVVVRPSGRGTRTLFDGGDREGTRAEISRPSWSPDGRSIAFRVLYDYGRWWEDSEVIVSRAGGRLGTFGCIARLHSPSFEPEPYDAQYEERRAAWSPDGLWIAVDGVAVCRTDGSTGYWLSPGLGPDWQPRGR